jgi:hypothetical protein
MKQTQFYIALALAAVCLVLSCTVIALGKSTQSTQMALQKRQGEIQAELQGRQAEVNKGAMSDKVGGAILQEMAAASLKNPKIKEALARDGYNVSANPSPSPGASAAPSTSFRP